MDYRTDNTDQELYRVFRAMPKIELHRHLEGSLRLGTLAYIARKHKLDMPGYTVEALRPLVQIMPDDAFTADIFLSKFKTLRHFYRSQEIIDRITYEAIADAAEENIVYMELRFTPKALAQAEGHALLDVADWVIAATNRARADFGIDVGLIISINRGDGLEIARQTQKVALARADKGIVGLDLSGPEHEIKAAPFADLFHEAREAGLGITIHAGEWAGPESVREAIEVVGAMRLGHGVRTVEDSDVLKLATERNVTFEVCITSNLQSGTCSNPRQHPIRDLFQIGGLTTINTDDPGISGINLTDEFVLAHKHVGLSVDDLKHNILHAAQSAFLPPEKRQKLIDRLRKELFPDGIRAGDPRSSPAVEATRAHKS